MVNLQQLEAKIDKLLFSETKETLRAWLNEKRAENMENFLTKEYIESLGFNMIKNSEQYFKASSLNGKVIFGGNREGNYIQIWEDAGTRTVFHGIVNNSEELDLIFILIR